MSECGDPAQLAALKPGKDDKVFRLDRVSPRMCEAR
jgi:hypothetical protein